MPVGIQRRSHASIAASDEERQQMDTLKSAFVVPLGGRSYSRQYAQLYDYRLAYLKKRILQRAHTRWVDNFEQFSQSQSQLDEEAMYSQTGDGVDAMDEDDQLSRSSKVPKRPRLSQVKMLDPPNHVDRILDIRQGEVCYIVGNLYCAMPLKPDVLEDLTREQWLAPQPVRTKYVDYARDELYIEDQSGRVKLVGDAIKGNTSLRAMLITGVVVAVLGTETRSGDFDVVDAVFAGLPPPTSSKQSLNKPARKQQNKADTKTADDEDKWMVLMSGMALGGADALEAELSMQFLTEWLSGELGDESDRIASSKVVSAIIAGNSLAPPVRKEEEAGARPKKYGQDGPTYSAAPTLALDQLLTDLCSAMPVHILPGERDPASVALPQQPIHFALLPRSGRFDSLHRETNPAWIGSDLGDVVHGRKILGTSGQNIDDIFKYVDEDDTSRIEMALRTLEWGHLAPTAPDTLWCYPYKTNDPFVIKHRPDILFIGNQPSYASALYHYDEKSAEDERDSPTDSQDTKSSPSGCRVILVPEFAKTKQVVLVNLATLDTKVVQVDAEL